ncbi:hypothetical protein GN956_G4445 [Arapaima gigas]
MAVLIDAKALLALATFNFLLLIPQLKSVGSFRVEYPRAFLKKMPGEKLELHCSVMYEAKECGNLIAFWCKHDNGTYIPLKNISRYNTKVSEFEQKEKLIRRLVEFEFKNLTLDDKGDYQCTAQCERGITAKGHFIKLDVRKAENAPSKPTNRSGLLKMDALEVYPGHRKDQEVMRTGNAASCRNAI